MQDLFEIQLFTSAFMAGVVGSSHCAAMCGGIAATLNKPANRIKTRTENTAGALNSSPDSNPILTRQLYYSFGRILTYAMLGALFGLIGTLALGSLSHFAGLDQHAIFISRMSTGIIFILMGLYLTQWWPVLVHLEKIGAATWQRLGQSFSAKLLSEKPKDWFSTGMLWGLLPCGLIYSTLILALTSGSALNGFIAMLCFGLGTLPAVVGIGLFSHWITIKNARFGAGLLMIGFGIATLSMLFMHDHSDHQHHHHNHGVHTIKTTDLFC